MQSKDVALLRSAVSNVHCTCCCGALPWCRVFWIGKNGIKGLWVQLWKWKQGNMQYYMSLQTSLNCITLYFIALHFSIAALHYNMPLQVSLHSALYLAAAEHSSALKAELCWVLLRRNPRHVWKRRLADSTQPHIGFRNFSTAFNAHHCITFPLVIVLNCIEVGEQNLKVHQNV